MTSADELSGDSSVLSVSYENGTALIEFDEGDDQYLIEVATRWFRSDAGAAHGTVHIRFENLADLLPVEPASGRYVLPPDFPSQMAAHRKGWILAVGLRQREFPLWLWIGGSALVFAAPVASKASVIVTPKAGAWPLPTTRGASA